MSDEFVIGGEVIQLRSRRLVELPLPPLYTHTPMTLPVHVVRGAKDGPRLFVSAALHGDELNGTEIIRRLLKQSVLKRLRGTQDRWRRCTPSAQAANRGHQIQFAGKTPLFSEIADVTPKIK